VGTTQVAPARQAVRAVPTAGHGRDLIWIYTVGGHTPDPLTGQVGTSLTPGQVQIVVESDPFTSWASSIDLYVTDLGPSLAPTAAPAARGAAAAGEKKRYKAHQVRLKLKHLTQAAAAPAGAAPAPASASATDSGTKWVLELLYLIDTEERHNYSAYAQGDYWMWTEWGFDIGTATSNTVTFSTGSAGGGPPGPASPAPGPIPRSK
jgi:hypothetical protein